MKYLYREQRLKRYLDEWAEKTALTCSSSGIDGRARMIHKSGEGTVRSLLHPILAQRKQLVPMVCPKRWIHEYAIQFAGKNRDWTKSGRLPT